MVTIRMFIPYLNMKNRFEAAVSRVQGQDDIRIELLHVFGTPESLSCIKSTIFYFNLFPGGGTG